MKTHRLAPYPGTNNDGGTPGARAKMMIDRATRVFPATISSTTIFNMPVASSLINILQQDVLEENNVAECQKVRPYNLFLGGIIQHISSTYPLYNYLAISYDLCML